MIFISGACETDPVIYVPADPVPVIYAVFDDHDTTHRILVTKSFGAEQSPAEFGFIHDSLYWKDIEVEVRLKERITRSWIVIHPDRVQANHKDSGLFLYHDQSYLYLTPETPLLFIWAGEGHAWSETDVAFEFIEDMDSGYRSQWVHIQNTQYFESAFDKFRQLNITYEEFIREVLAQVKDDPAVKRRYLGIIKMDILGGDRPMVEYMRYLNGYTDYSSQGFTNITNGLGIMATITRFTKDSMNFDYETRQILLNENRLRRLRISPWTISGYFH